MSRSDYRKPGFGTRLPRTTPAQAGVREEDIEAMIREYAKEGMRIHSFILVRNGFVFGEGYYSPYDRMQPQTVYSLSKSFTSAAIGIACSDGILSLEERIADIFADELREYGIVPDAKFQAMKIRHLLTMSTGQEEQEFGEDSIRLFLEKECVDRPGERFRYQTSATYLCSAALYKKGIDLEEYLNEKLFAPMGVSGMHWQRCRKGICMGGIGLSLLPEVIAKFGILLLQDGRWNDRQLIPADYVRLATSKQINNSTDPDTESDWGVGYGYQFWQCRHNSFRGDGRYGQLCVVSREKGAVLAMTAFLDDMQKELDIYYRNILEKMQDMPIEEPEPDERDGLKKALFEPACLMEPMEDDGTEIPEDYLQKEISIRERGVMRLYRAGKELEAEVMAGADTERVRLSRGGFRDQETWRRNSIYVQGRIAASLPHSTRILAGYGMQEGRLVLRIFVPEMLEDLKIVLTCTEKGILVEFYDVHNPAEPVKL